MSAYLLPCPMCGASKGYRLSEGSTYRWWWVLCVACGRTVDECCSDSRKSIGTPLPARWPNADATWNDAAAHAESLRAEIESLRAVLTDLAATCYGLADQQAAQDDWWRPAYAAALNALGVEVEQAPP